MHEKKLNRWYSVASAVFLIAFFVFVYASALGLDYAWDFSVIWPFLWQTQTHSPGLILQGLWGTIYISLVSIAIGTPLGFILGLLFYSREPVARTAVLAYVDIFRNTPMLVQLYVAYFVVGTALDLSAVQAGVLTLSLFCAAYIADLVRGTLLNFERGQLDAARSLGMSDYQVARYIMAPQMLRRMMPPLVGQFVTLVKDSSLVSAIGILDLTKAALNVVASNFRSFETWFFIAAVYFLINIVLSSFGRYLEHRLAASLR